MQSDKTVVEGLESSNNFLSFFRQYERFSTRTRKLVKPGSIV